MPIRFRCTNCEKLLGIGRRKAGSLVTCPSCQKQTQVPTLESLSVERTDVPGDPTEHDSPPLPPEPVAAGAPGAPPRAGRSGEASRRADKPARQGQLFENPDLEDLLRPIALGADGNRAAKELDAKADALPPPPPVPRPASQAKTTSPGFWISPQRATWLSVGAVLILGVVFTLGIVVGRAMRP